MTKMMIYHSNVMNITKLIKEAIGTRCTYASFVKDVKGKNKIKLNVLTEEGKKKELRFNVDKPITELTDNDLKDLLHVVFKQIFTTSWNNEAEKIFQK